MEQTAYEIATAFLGRHELITKDNGYPQGMVTIEDALRAIRLALSTHTQLLTGTYVKPEEDQE